MKKILLASTFLIFILTSCSNKDNSKQEWTSLIYPDKNNTKRSKKFAVYKTLKECKEGSLKELERLGLSSKGTYQCGLNCTYNEGMKVDICEELSK